MIINFLKKTCCFTVALLAGTLNIQAQTTNNTVSFTAAINKIEPKVIAWRHQIHQNPELGNNEIKTALLIANHLKALGLGVKTGVAKTGVVGILIGGKPGPVIALRADMDALPVEEKNDLPFASKVKTTFDGKETFAMHACGHDAHVAILMGVAELLAGIKKDLKGTIKFIFQPAEEGAPHGEEGGAELMIKENVLENPKVDVIFGLHMDALADVGTIKYRPAGFMAGVSSLKITVNGKGSHGAQPWFAVDPIVVSAQIVNSLQTIVSRNVKISENPAVVTIGAIHGGNRTNIISDKVEMLGTIRTFSLTDEKLVKERIKTIAEKTAEAFGATALVDIPYGHQYPITFNNIALTNNMLPSLQKSVGKNNVILSEPITGAEDFSFFQQKVPGLYFFIGGLTKGKDVTKAGPHHTSYFMLDDAAYKTGLTTLCNLVFDYAELKK